MATMRELKERIHSVHSSQKITGAMKMISSVRLRKAESKLQHSQPYQIKLWDIYRHIMASGCDYESPLTQERAVKRVSLVIHASDDGLCGAFNINLYKELVRTVREYRERGVKDITVYAVGKKIWYDIRRMPGIQVADLISLPVGGDYSHEIQDLADKLISLFLAGETDRVDIIYMHYKSIGVQTLANQCFLPVKKEEKQPSPQQKLTQSWYVYEPDCVDILQTLYPLILHALMYETFLENRTSEQAARILAMQSANDNANKLLGNLHLEYNKLRQQDITSELLDIAGGTTR